MKKFPTEFPDGDIVTSIPMTQEQGEEIAAAAKEFDKQISINVAEATRAGMGARSLKR